MAFKGQHVEYGHYGFGRSRSLSQSVPLKPYPMTWIWNVYVDAATPSGEYATFFAFGPDSFTGTDYYTAAVVSDNVFSVGADGTDNTGPAVATGRWYRQALVCYRNSNTHSYFYYDLPDISKVLHSQVSGTSYFAAPGATSFFRFGDVAWAQHESLAGRFFGCKAFSAALSPRACAIEAASPYPQLPEYAPRLWGLWPFGSNMNPFDRSGNNRTLFVPSYPDGGTRPDQISDGPHISHGLGVPAFDYSPELLVDAAGSALTHRSAYPLGALSF